MKFRWNNVVLHRILLFRLVINICYDIITVEKTACMHGFKDRREIGEGIRLLPYLFSDNHTFTLTSTRRYSYNNLTINAGGDERKVSE